MRNNLSRIVVIFFVLLVISCNYYEPYLSTGTTNKTTIKTESTSARINKKQTKKHLDKKIARNGNNNISLYYGPGKNYKYYRSVNENMITKYIIQENSWIEVECNQVRAYVKKSDLTNPPINLPEVSNISPSFVGPFPNKIYSKLNIDLQLPTSISYYAAPNGRTLGQLQKNTLIKLIRGEQSNNFVDYFQIEININETPIRTYVLQQEIFNIYDALRNFEEIKQNNASIEYDNKIYYSTSGVASFGGWQCIKSMTKTERQFNLIDAIVGAIGSNTSNIDQIPGIDLLDVGEGIYIRQDTRRVGAYGKISNASFLIDTFNNAMKSGNKIITLKIELQTFQGNNRLVILTGKPIETVFNGRIYRLSEDYGYYVILDKDLNVYLYPKLTCKDKDVILHVYEKYDYLMQMNKEQAAFIVEILKKAGFSFSSTKQMIDLTSLYSQVINDNINFPKGETLYFIMDVDCDNSYPELLVETAGASRANFTMYRYKDNQILKVIEDQVEEDIQIIKYTSKTDSQDMFIALLAEEYTNSALTSRLWVGDSILLEESLGVYRYKGDIVDRETYLKKQSDIYERYNQDIIIPNWIWK